MEYAIHKSSDARVSTEYVIKNKESFPDKNDFICPECNVRLKCIQYDNDKPKLKAHFKEAFKGEKHDLNCSEARIYKKKETFNQYLESNKGQEKFFISDSNNTIINFTTVSRITITDNDDENKLLKNSNQEPKTRGPNINLKSGLMRMNFKELEEFREKYKNHLITVKNPETNKSQLFSIGSFIVKSRIVTTLEKEFFIYGLANIFKNYDEEKKEYHYDVSFNHSRSHVRDQSGARAYDPAIICRLYDNFIKKDSEAGGFLEKDLDNFLTKESRSGTKYASNILVFIWISGERYKSPKTKNIYLKPYYVTLNRY